MSPDLEGAGRRVAALRVGLAQIQVDIDPERVGHGTCCGIGHGLRSLLMSHPPLEERIQTLRNAPLGQAAPDGACIFTGDVAVERVLPGT